MGTRKVIGFPGQGSQAKGMGQELFARFPELVRTADSVLGYSVAELCAANPDNRLRSTRFAQPALFVVEALAYLSHQQRDPGPPDAFAGHSLGEYPALFAAGVFDFATGLRLVQRRGELMSECPAGAMAAVLGVGLPEVRDLLRTPGLEAVDIAIHNAPGQIAVAGPLPAVEQLAAVAAEAGVRCVLLNVSGPFHSRHLGESAQRFASFLDGFELSPPRVPVIANATARPHAPGLIKEALVRQMTDTVLWLETMHHLLSEGEFEFIELGPGQVLTGMLERTRNAYSRSPGTQPVG